MTMYGFTLLDISIFGNPRHWRLGKRKKGKGHGLAILATANGFPELLWPGEGTGGVWLGARTKVPAWWILRQSKVNFTQKDGGAL